ncbi:START domain-containing protein [Cinnamomum micranthum f. kanehirae]|uniref:START domain-containing protein n=1 Tax=Cinnamomum micranthum f. kanehirae TaxID=337451 RepID=A0A3S3MX05_9MAGN|nr:START domain-containing protein [Cinnamomum micranthum f. kanehirae]
MDAKPWYLPTTYLAGISVGSMEFKRENIHGGWATFLVLLSLFIWRSLKAYLGRSRGDSAAVKPQIPRNSNSASIGISEIIMDADLANLINTLDGKLNEKERWEDVIDKRNNLMSYKAKCCKPKDGPLKYISVTTFENCSIELLRDFYMDNEYRKEWDKTLVEHVQLQIDESSGTEIGHTIKKFPLLTPREYVLAWRVWEGKDKTFYCFIKECEHARVPRQKKYVRVGFFRSGWRIRKVPGRDACEIAMVHQEDAGLNVEMAKIAFAKGIWSYVCKMDSALRKYSTALRSKRSPLLTSLKFIQKVPHEFESITPTAHRDISESFASGEFGERKKISRNKSIAKGLLLVGGIICLSRGHASLGAKVMMACIVKKLATKHGSVSSRVEQMKQITSQSTLEK